jgi:hypothetical protein
MSNRGRVDHSGNSDIRSRVRAKRANAGGPRDRLTPAVELDPSLHYCWVNDDERGSVMAYQDQGYEFVLSNASVGETTPDKPSDSTESLVWKNVGNGLVAYLMAIPRDIYDEDRKAEENERREGDSDMFRNFEGSYSPFKPEVEEGTNKR